MLKKLFIFFGLCLWSCQLLAVSPPAEDSSIDELESLRVELAQLLVDLQLRSTTHSEDEDLELSFYSQMYRDVADRIEFERENQRIQIQAWGRILDRYQGKYNRIVLIHEAVEESLVFIHRGFLRRDHRVTFLQDEGMISRLGQQDIHFWKDNILFEIYEKDGLAYVRMLEGVQSQQRK